MPVSKSISPLTILSFDPLLKQNHDQKHHREFLAGLLQILQIKLINPMRRALTIMARKKRPGRGVLQIQQNLGKR